MVTEAQAQKSYTPAEYLELEVNSEEWLLSEYSGEDAALSLASIALQIPLSDLYDKVDFEAEV
ncbi:hypothetical protein [Gloeothece verrucosa]|uniref:Uncharacterized protein n=1 Tax=Gloeothece verrucosa (strain PCC 7822) TaxID=497965 RepID=E0UE52_GLOV7|nr:hypothetical protein [Gloeothece verrucosa]ADN14177.1 protein of unknown function DUF820 [Gloeothece verrucosa PCC 7822]